MRKTLLLVALIVLNAVLVLALVARTSQPRLAWAQGTGLNENYLIVTAEVRDQYDAVYLLDTRSRYLHAFWFDLGRRQLQYAGFRDLERGFRNNRSRP